MHGDGSRGKMAPLGLEGMETPEGAVESMMEPHGAQHPQHCLLPGTRQRVTCFRRSIPSPSPSGFINSPRGEVSINNGCRIWLVSWVMRFSTCCSCAAVIMFGGPNSMWIN